VETNFGRNSKDLTPILKKLIKVLISAVSILVKEYLRKIIERIQILYENFAGTFAIGNPLSLKLAKPILMSVKYPEQKYRVELLSMWEQGGELQALVEYVLERNFLTEILLIYLR